MEPLFQNWYDNYVMELRQFANEENDFLIQCKKSVYSSIQVIEKLKEFIFTHPFNSAEAEIDFFKHVKPLFQSRLIYWLKVLRYELNKPSGTPGDRESYILGELNHVKFFFDNNIEFYRYFRFGDTHSDAEYFCRTNNTSNIIPDIDMLDKDPSFSTSHDQKLSCLLAYEMLTDFLNSELEIKNPRKSDRLFPGTENTIIHWTAPKTGLIELMYACNSCGAFNHGNASIQQIAGLFEQIFNIQLGNYYRTFQEIRIRKKGRTVFLDQMREKLINRMDHADENPR